MAFVNESYLSLQGSYLFSTIAKKVEAFEQAHPEVTLIRLGIGDVTRPLVPAVIDALHQAVDEMGKADTFQGYGPEQGHLFLREAISNHDYKSRGIPIDAEDIFISDGSKQDIGNFQELFATHNRVAITDPVYPVYVDSNVMAGRGGHFDGKTFTNIVYLPCTAETGFVPSLPTEPVDIVYLCSPNNPTGTVLTKEELTKWVQYAKENQVILLYDSAYEAYITDDDIPHSIYEIPGALEVAVEFRSFSKTAGFTGTRCAYTVVPKSVVAYTKEKEAISLQALWNRRQSTKFNGVPYIVQRAAEAVYSPEGYQQTRENIAYYMENARIIREGLTAMGLTVYGGVHAPYIWVQAPSNKTSWEFFDCLLEQAHVITTPGSGFGPHGEGFLRLTAFGSREDTVTAIARIQQLSF